MKNTHCDTYIHCLTGKQYQVLFVRNASNRYSHILILIHFDAYGPIKVKNFGRTLNFVILINDCSRKVWAYVFKTKYQVADIFQEFQAKMKREEGTQMHQIR